jgi:diguanylate cyclase (GGDEF)-like protein
MRIHTNNGSVQDGGNGIVKGNKYSIIELHSEIECIKPLFDNIILVNPFENLIIEVHDYGLSDSHTDCKSVCPLKDDTCGCICKDSLSTGENRCRFIYSKTSAYLVISKMIKMLYKDYVLVMIMRLNPAFQFGTHNDGEAIESITKLSSNLVIDPLTKIFNRKYLMDNIDYLIQNSMKQRICLCLACIDIDNFKRFNDTYGHEFGDKVLQNVANTMVSATSVIKEAYNIRIGGDEFVIVGVGIDKQRFKAIMSKLCIMVDSNKLQYKNELVSVKISIGVSELLSDKIDTYKQLYDTADGNLYKAKEAGKGCVR